MDTDMKTFSMTITETQYTFLQQEMENKGAITIQEVIRGYITQNMLKQTTTNNNKKE